jgi:hypothetical protein
VTICPLLHRRILLPQLSVGPQNAPDSQVIAQRQTTLHHDIGVGPGQPLWLLECPPQRDAELAERFEPSLVRACDAAATSCPATTISQSMTGLAARPSTEVLPTCSMATTGTPAAAIAPVYSRRNRSNRCGHAGSYSATTITPGNLHSAVHRPDTRMGR